MSFISNYLLAASNNESPAVFHKWSCLAAISTLAGRRFHFKLGPIVYYPHMYVCLVADPGVKKSFAMDKAKDIIRAVGGIPVAATQTTKEAITKEMSHEKFPGKKFFKNGDGVMEEYNQLAIFATELTQFIGVNPLGMLDFLTTIYTEKHYDARYKNQGSDFFAGPYITMLACMTPETAKGYLKQNILTGGFSRRTVFVYGTGGNIIPIPSFTPEQQQAVADCVAWGKEVQHQSGEFVFGPGAEEWYCNWYTNLQKNIKSIAKPNTEHYFRTKHEILFKAAMCFALSENPPGDMRILPEHFEILEKRFFAPAEEKLERVFEGSGINPNANAAIQVCNMLESMDRPMNRKTLEGMFYDKATSIAELRETIDHLVAVERLAQKTITLNGRLIGTVIASPECLKRYADADLATFLLRPSVPQSQSLPDPTP